jgi:hypothetical protein
MRRFLILASLVAVAVLATAAPADARHHRGRVGFSFHFGFPGYYPYYPAYYPAYAYAPRPVYAAPAYVAPAYAAPPAGVTLREGRDAAGNYCREYQTNTIIEGRPTPSYGTACMRADGQWQIVN